MSHIEVVPEDTDLIDLLIARDGTPTLIYLQDGNVYTVYNIVWGYDMGDPYAHVTTNISPDIPSASIDFFLTDQVVEAREPISGKTLYATK